MRDADFAQRTLHSHGRVRYLEVWFHAVPMEEDERLKKKVGKGVRKGVRTEWHCRPYSPRPVASGAHAQRQHASVLEKMNRAGRPGNFALAAKTFLAL